jgi:hypothetical protein
VPGKVVPQRQDELGATHDRRAAAAVPPGAVGEAAQRLLATVQGNQVRSREAQPVEPGPERPHLTAEAPRVQAGQLDPCADHARRDGVGVQDGAYGAAVPVVEQPRSGKPQHAVTVPHGAPVFTAEGLESHRDNRLSVHAVSRR